MLHNHIKRRKSYLTVTTRTPSQSETSVLELRLSDCHCPDSASKGLLAHSARQQQQWLSHGHRKAPSEAGKENVGCNRALIRMKPRKFMGSEHFLWRRERDDRS